MTNRNKIGLAAIIAYAASIPLANWLINHVGTLAFPGGPHTIPVGFGQEAPSGVLAIGVALTARDIVQRSYGKSAALAAIILGCGLSYMIAPNLAWASAAAFALGELADFAVYTPLANRNLAAAVLLSGTVGALIDSIVFLQIAFDSTMFWQGNTIGKIWASAAALPFVYLARRAVPNHAAH